MNHKLTLYFLLAMLPSMMEAQNPPANSWEWFKWGGKALFQGLLAIKAYQSNPEPALPNQPQKPPVLDPTKP